MAVIIKPETLNDMCEKCDYFKLGITTLYNDNCGVETYYYCEHLHMCEEIIRLYEEWEKENETV